MYNRLNTPTNKVLKADTDCVRNDQTGFSSG